MLFLDLDGCLVDSAPAILMCLDEALGELNQPPLQRGEAEGIIGPPIGVSARRLLLDRGVFGIDSNVLVQGFRQIYARKSATRTPAQPGILEALSVLAPRFRMVVVTSKAKILAEPIIEATGIGKYLDGVFGPDIDDTTEPKHVTLRRAMVATASSSGIVIGDREHDIHAAHHERLVAIGVTWGAGSLAELRAAGADVIIDAPSELENAISHLLSFRERMELPG